MEQAQQRFEGAHILVVDDEQLTVRAIDRVLRACGARVTTCTGAPQALEVVQESRVPFDAAVVDYYLLDREGTEVINALRSGYFPCCTLMITGAANPEPPLRAIQAGADAFLIKPFDVAPFVEAVETCLGRTREWRRDLREVPNDPTRVTSPPFKVTDAAAQVRDEGIGLRLTGAPGVDLHAHADRLALTGKLSARERQALVLVLQGKKNTDISTDLGITTRTVKFHVRNILRKLEVKSRGELTGLLFD